MMRRVYLLIDTAKERAGNVAELLRDKPGVMFADAVTGPPSCPNVIAVVERTDVETVAHPTSDIYTIPGVNYITGCYVIGDRPPGQRGANIDRSTQVDSLGDISGVGVGTPPSGRTGGLRRFHAQ
jgi:hypothetical protein